MSEFDKDVTQNLKTSLANEMSMLKTKLMNMEEWEMHREVEMEEIRRMIFDQQSLMKRLLIEMSDMKKGTDTTTTLTEI